MKKLIAIFALVLSTLAAAESTLIFETKNYSNYDVTPTFDVNKNLGRAWVNILLAEFRGDSSTYSDELVKIEGLTYDAATKSIVLNRNGETIVCGTFYNQRWVIDFGGTIRSTKRCTFKVKKVTVETDEGFEIVRVPMIQVYLNVQ